jgi:hypothetical protein
MILPSPLLPVHARSSMPEPDPGFSSPPDMLKLNGLPPYQTLHGPESTVRFAYSVGTGHFCYSRFHFNIILLVFMH